MHWVTSTQNLFADFQLKILLTSTCFGGIFTQNLFCRFSADSNTYPDALVRSNTKSYCRFSTVLKLTDI